MSFILSLDLGANSIGWALFDDEENKYLKTGVRIFQDINTDNDNTQGNANEDRREQRQRRRLIFRKKYKKLLLYNKLKEIGLINSNIQSYSEFIQSIFHLNPYQLRYEALTRKLTEQELCRVLFHFAQRRGFLSNRKSSREIIGEVKQQIKELEEKIQNKTLGQFLFELYPLEYQPYEYKERIRQRYTSRYMYYDELIKIWEFQSKFYPEILNEDNKKAICDFKKGIIFYQRPLKSQKNLVGKCVFEKNKTRCPKSRYEYQEFAFYQFINNIEILDHNGEIRQLNKSEIDKILEAIIATKKSSKNLTIGDLQKKHKLNIISQHSKNLDQELPPISFVHFVHNLFPKSYIEKHFANDFYGKIEDLWELLNFVNDTDFLIEKMKLDKHFPEDPQSGFIYDQKRIELIDNYYHTDGYGSLSLKAIKNILPFLKMGFKYHIATILGGIKRAFGNEYDKLSDKQKSHIISKVQEIYYEQQTSISKPDLVKDFLRKEFNLSDEALNKMYIHTQVDGEHEIFDRLPKFNLNIRNPKVTRAIDETRKIINELLDRDYKIDKIIVEIATELKKSSEDLKKIKNEQFKNRKANIAAYEYLTNVLEIVNPTRDMIEKYRLYTEMLNVTELDKSSYFKPMCPYTGKEITLENLFEDGKFDVDHIIPFSRSFNDSLGNKVICDAQFNRHEKGNQTPYEYFKNNDPNEWEFIKQRAKKILPKEKYKRFIAETVPDEEDFASNKLNDTRYIAKVAVDYLKQIGAKVQVVSGSVTGIVRRYWGLNSILNELNKHINIEKENKLDYDTKNRIDHRHHAIDAMVLCLISPKIIKDISTLKTRKLYETGIKTLPYPWQSFKNDVENIISELIVSHKRRNPVASIASKYILVKGKKIKIKTLAPRGPLHNETFYGLRINPDTQKEVFVHRVSLSNLDNENKINKIMDNNVREIVLKHFKNKASNKNVFFKLDENKRSVPLVYLPNKRGNPVPIKKVRVFEEKKNIRQIGDYNKWVEPSNNHHAELYQKPNGKIYQKLVTLWEAVERAKNKQPIYRDINNNDKLIATIERNEIFALGLPKNLDLAKFKEIKHINKYLYRVQKISFINDREKPYYTFRNIVAATLKFPEQEIRITSFDNFKKNNPYKVILNNLGEIINIIDVFN